MYITGRHPHLMIGLVSMYQNDNSDVDDDTDSGDPSRNSNRR